MSEPSERSLVTTRRRSLAWFLPVVSWLPRYQWRRTFFTDLVAGLALAALLIPESIGYAGVAGVAPELGLYAALGAVAAYFLTGGTSILVVGPAAAVAALSASLVAGFGGDVDPAMIIPALAITSGVLLLVAGLLRFGWVANFISRPVLDAFIAALSISIIIGQLDSLLGVAVEGESPIAKLLDALSRVRGWHWLTVAVGVVAILVLLASERFAPRLPSALLVVAVGIFLVAVVDLDADGVGVIGHIPQGLPSVAIPDLGGTRWIELIAGGAALLLVGFSEGFAAATSVATQTKESVDPDQELVGSGAANLAAGLLGGVPVGGSLSKSAAAELNGARSQMANLVSGAVVLASLLFLAPLFERLPSPVLAAVVIVAVAGSASPAKVLRLWDVNRLDFAAGLVTFVLVLVWDTLPALAVGVVLSLVFMVRRISFPDVVELQISPNDNLVATAIPGIPTHPIEGVAILRFEAPLIYANAERLVQAVETLTERRDAIHRVVLDAEMISDLDATGAQKLARVDDLLAEQDITLHLAHLNGPARDLFERSPLTSRFSGRIHAGIEEAIGPPRADHVVDPPDL